MKTIVCCIFNSASHYRFAIYQAMIHKLNFHLYFGNENKDRILDIDLKFFNNQASNLNTIFLSKKITWIAGSIKLVFLDYNKFILTGSPYCLSNWFIIIIARILKKEVYLWTHGFYGNEFGLRKRIKILFFKLSNGLFLYGDYAKKLMIKNGFNSSKLHVVYNSLDYEKQLFFRLKSKSNLIFKNYFNNNYKNIIFIGRLTPVKKLHLIIEALALGKISGFNFNIIFLGSGESEFPLKQLVDKLKLTNNCWFFGTVYDEKIISKFLSNADLCVSPGNVGLTAIHCHMYGLPVITHNNFASQMPEFEIIVPKVTGDFFIENDPQDLLKTIRLWFELNLDREYIKNACWSRVDSFYNPNYQLSIFKKIYD